VRSLYLGTYGGKHCYVSELEHANELPHGHELQGLRTLFGRVDETLAVLAGRAFQIMEWDRNHQFCSRCGTPTVARSEERVRACPRCRYTIYPPVSPAIMILVKRGREVLLAAKRNGRPGATARSRIRRAGRKTGRHGTARDARGSRRGNREPALLRQPAVAVPALADGCVHRRLRGRRGAADGIEIQEARWFDVEQLPQLPPSISISRRLITTIAGKLARGERSNG